MSGLTFTVEHNADEDRYLALCTELPGIWGGGVTPALALVEALTVAVDVLRGDVPSVLAASNLRLGLTDLS